MFDFHLHSSVSFDSECKASDMVKKAEQSGFKAICFTDHYDCHSNPDKVHNLFTLEEYDAEYSSLKSDSVKILQGVEFGLTDWNREEFLDLTSKQPFDFVIGSAHFVDGYDPYDAEYWIDMSVKDAFEKYLNGVLRYVKIHSGFDVLGHLTYVCKSAHNPTHEPVRLSEYLDITDEIMKVIISKGIGMEINTSGVDKAGVMLPTSDFIKRYKELGGEVVTVGSDAHDDVRLGQYIPEALEILRDVFGYVCTFEDRKPIFHKL